MSGTRRTPINRRHIAQVTPAAVKMFAEMLRCACTCDDSPSVAGGFDEDYRYLRRDCPGCKRWHDLEQHLHRELRLRPWQDTVEDPRSVSPYPAGCPADLAWRPDEEARQRWRVLEAGVREMRREEREMRRARAEARQQPAPSVPNA